MTTPIIEEADSEEVFRNLMRHTTIGSTSESESEVRELVTEWLASDPATLPGYSDMYWDLVQVNFQAALEAFLAEPGRESRVFGIQTPSTFSSEQVPFSRLLSPPSMKWGGAAVGMLETARRTCGYKRFLRCIERGLVLFRDAEGPGAIWIRHQPGQPLNVEVITNPAHRAPQLIEELRALSDERSPYHGEMFRVMPAGDPEFLRRHDPMTADDIILPPGVLEKLDQHTVTVARSRKKLKQLGMHLKRGILMHGPPGTGKTHAIRYLASNMRDATFVILPKQAIGMAHQLVSFLEPAVIVLDDVDLVAENRSLPGMTERHRLFEVLETLDGLLDTSDVLFVLTTNRIDTMEPAIASRPGRVDQTIEISRPDADCRRRLFELYRRGVDLDLTDAEIDEVLVRTDGVTASFFKELLRRATVKAVKRVGADDEGNVKVTAEVLFESLDRMLDPDNPMTRLLLGADPDHPDLAVALQD